MNYNKQMMEIKALHETQFEALREMQLLQVENELMTEEEKNARILEMKTEHDEREKAMEEQKEKDIKAIRDEAAREEMLRLADIAGAAGKGMEFSKNMLEELKEDHAAFGVAYKASQIGEATMNAAQSVLRTMAGTPSPWNIPLALAQAAAAAVYVGKIASAKMYRGGMIPGMNTLVMANEQGQEAILSVRGVRAAGGAAGVNALNSGASSNYSYDNSRTNTIVINTSIMTQKAYRDEIEPVLRRAERRR